MRNIGIWLDKKQAKVVSIENGLENVTIIESNIDTRPRIEGEGSETGRFGDQFVDDEKNKLHREQEQKKKFFGELKNEFYTAVSAVIFGPAEMKNEFAKVIKDDSKVNSKLVGVETADSMTDNQVVAWVKDFFKKLDN